MRKLFAIVTVYEEREDGVYELHRNIRITPNSVLDGNAPSDFPIAHHYFNYEIVTDEREGIL